MKRCLSDSFADLALHLDHLEPAGCCGDLARQRLRLVGIGKRSVSGTGRSHKIPQVDKRGEIHATPTSYRIAQGEWTHDAVVKAEEKR